MAVTANKPRPRSAKPSLHSQAPLVGVFSVLMAMAFARPVHAVDWRFEPSVGASATYTDNVDQSEDDEENALILTATPGFTLRSEGSRRIQAAMHYGLTGVARFGGDDDNDLNHNLNATGYAELIEDFLFIDGTARVSQELISLLGSPADADINDSNRATTASYSISPYIKKRFGTFADAEARYTLNGTLIEDDAASDLVSNELRASLNSGSRFNTLSWGLAYTYRDVSDEDSGNGDGDVSDEDSGNGDASYAYERTDLSLGYALTRKFRLIGNVGYESIEYENAAASANDRDDTIWSAGFAWAPSRRTSLEATMGERFFGNTYSLQASYRARESVWTASYVEDVNDISRVMLTEGTAYIWNCNGSFVETGFNIAPQPGCTLVGTRDGLIPSLADGVYVSKTLRAGMTWGIRKVSYGVNVFDITRIYLQQNDAEDQSQGVQASVNYRMDPITNLYGNLDWTRTEDPATLSGIGIDREDDLYSFIIGVNHQFGRDLTGALTYRHYRRDSNDPSAEYTENNISALVNMRF